MGEWVEDGRQNTVRRAYRRRGRPGHRGVSTLDYVLILGVVLPLVAFIMWIGPRIIRLVYEMACTLIASPFF